MYLMFSNACNYQDSRSTRNNPFNEGWKFIKDNPEYAKESNYNDSNWRTVDLPHDISIEGLTVQDSTHIGPFSKDIEMSVDVGFLEGGTAWGPN